MLNGKEKAEALARKLSVKEKKLFILNNAENYDPIIEMVFEFILEKLREEMVEQDYIAFCDSI